MVTHTEVLRVLGWDLGLYVFQAPVALWPGQGTYALGQSCWMSQRVRSESVRPVVFVTNGSLARSVRVANRASSQSELLLWSFTFKGHLCSKPWLFKRVSVATEETLSVRQIRKQGSVLLLLDRALKINLSSWHSLHWRKHLFL